MLMAVINHPWLLEQHCRGVSALDFLNPDADQLRRAILDTVTGEEAAVSQEAVRAAVVGRGFSGVGPGRGRHHPIFPTGRPEAGAGPEDMGPWWTLRWPCPSQAAHVK